MSNRQVVYDAILSITSPSALNDPFRKHMLDAFLDGIGAKDDEPDASKKLAQP